MKQVTIEDIVNISPKKLILDTMYNVFEIKKEKKAVVRGFRNIKLEQAPEIQLKTAFIEFLKKINPSKFEEVPSLKEFEELYNKDPYLCYGGILIGLACEKNIDLCLEAYEKFFANQFTSDETADEVVTTTGDDANIAKKLKKEIELNKTLKETIDAMRQNLDSKDATIESLQKKLESKEKSIVDMKKTKKDKERDVNELRKDNKNLQNKIEECDKTIDENNNEINRLKDENAMLRTKLELFEKELESIKNMNKDHIVVYGYHEEYYDCSLADDVIQPETLEELLSIGDKYKVACIYFRAASLGRITRTSVEKRYPDIPIEAKCLEELKLMGYLKIRC